MGLAFTRSALEQFGYRQMFLHHVVDETRFSGANLNASGATID